MYHWLLQVLKILGPKNATLWGEDIAMVKTCYKHISQEKTFEEEEVFSIPTCIEPIRWIFYFFTFWGEDISMVNGQWLIDA